MEHIYERYKLRQELISKGIRKELGEWVWELIQNGEMYRKYLDAGFKNFRLVKEAVKAQVEPFELLQFKKQLMASGMDEETAERWLSIGDFDKVMKFYKKGYSLNQTALFLWHKKDASFVESIVNRLQKHGLTREEAKEDLAYSFIINFIKPSQRKIVEAVQKAEEHGFKSLALFIMADLKGIDKTKERVNWYMSFGLSQLQAEWWVAAEMRYEKKLSEEILRKWLSAGVKRSKEIEAAVFMTVNYERLGIDELIRWHKAGVYDPNLWLNEGHTLETAVYWERKNLKIPNKINPEVFEELLQESYSDDSELISWLKAENFDVGKIKEWFSLGVKDKDTYWAFRDAGLSLEDAKELLRAMPLEQLLEKLDNGLSKEDLFKEVGYKRSLKRTAELFRRKR